MAPPLQFDNKGHGNGSGNLNGSGKNNGNNNSVLSPSIRLFCNETTVNFSQSESTSDQVLKVTGAVALIAAAGFAVHGIHKALKEQPSSAAQSRHQSLARTVIEQENRA
jgi:hypothetical protein